MPFRARAFPSSVAKRRVVSRRSACVFTARRPIATFRTDFFTSSGSPRTPLAPASAPTRHASTSTTPSPSFSALTDFFSFGRGRSQSVSPGTARKVFLHRAEKGDIAKMVEAYDLIVEHYRRIASSTDSQSGSSAERELYLTSDDLALGMRVLADAHDPLETITRLIKIYADVEGVFGLSRTAQHHAALITGLCRCGRIQNAVEVATKVPADQIDWSDFLVMAHRYHRAQFDLVWEEMARRRVVRERDWEVYIRCMRQRVADGQRQVPRLDAVLARMKEDGVAMSQKSEAELVRWYILERRVKDAKRILDRWDAEGRTGEALGEEGWRAQLAWGMLANDQAAVEQRCLEMKECGNQPPGWAMAWLIRQKMAQGVDLEDAVDHVEMRTESATDSAAWASVIGDDLRSSTISRAQADRAMSAYRIARRRGVEVDTSLAKAILIPLSKVDGSIDDIIEIYEDVLANDIDLYEIRNVKRLRKMTRIIFVACSAQSPPRSEMALRLLQTVADRKISMPESVFALERLVANAPNHQVAYDLYTAFTEHTTLDERWFKRIVNAFLYLTPPDGSFVFPPVDLMLDLIRDLRFAGYSADHFILTTLLSRYGHLASIRRGVPTQVMKQRLDVLRHAIANIHLQIKLNPMIEIDVPLLNALMDAYNRVDAVEDAFLIWNELVERRARLPVAYAKRHYEASVLIALDICAFKGADKRAEKIWAWANRHDFVRSLKAWNGWIECLCRLGRFDEALQIILGDMRLGSNPVQEPGQGQGPGQAQEQAQGQGQTVPRANVETVRIFTKFSWRIVNDRGEMLERIQAAYPEFWDEVKPRMGSRWKYGEGEDRDGAPEPQASAVRQGSLGGYSTLHEE